MTERLTLIVGEYTISELRSGKAVEFDDGVTILPASDLATNDALRARVAKLEAALREARGWVINFDNPEPFQHHATLARIDDALGG